MKQAVFSNREPIFVIGYPKSGNTWFARLLADALDSPMVGGKNPIDIADIGLNHSHSGGYIIHKLHHSERSRPAYIREGSKVFYIVRDVRDVLVSGFFHFHRNAGEDKYTLKASCVASHLFYRYYFFWETSRMIKKWQGTEIDMFKHKIKRLLGALYHFENEKNANGLHIGNWSEHVNYWIEFPNACVVRYEDLLADTYTTLKNLFGKTGIRCSEQHLIEVIKRQSFKVRKKEFQKKGDQINTKFMRKGVAGDWKRFLDEKLIQRIKKAHGPTMNRLGYEI